MPNIWTLSVIGLFVTALCITNGNARLITADDDSQLPYQDGQVETISVKEKIHTIISGWRRLSDESRQRLFHSFSNPIHTPKKDSQSRFKLLLKHTLQTGVRLYSYYSYLYYYPTMYWDLVNVPDTYNYWVGIYKVGASNRNYITYKWLWKNKKGSYYIGKLSTTYGEASTSRNDKYELRLFKNGYTLIAADSTVLHGAVASPVIVREMEEEEEEEAKPKKPEIEPKLRYFIKTLESVLPSLEESTSKGHLYSQEELATLWSEFDAQEQQLLLPILEQDSLPKHIRKPGPRSDNRPEPNVLYGHLKEGDEVPTPDYTVKTAARNTLTIKLRYSYTYVYPVVRTARTLSGKWSWVGMYREDSSQSYNSGSFLKNRWQWVGPGYQRDTQLDYIKEYNTGPLDNSYVGAVFDWINGAYRQIGLSPDTIRAATYTCITCD